MVYDSPVDRVRVADTHATYRRMHEYLKAVARGPGPGWLTNNVVARTAYDERTLWIMTSALVVDAARHLPLAELWDDVHKVHRLYRPDATMVHAKQISVLLAMACTRCHDALVETLDAVHCEAGFDPKVFTLAFRRIDKLYSAAQRLIEAFPQ